MEISLYRSTSRNTVDASADEIAVITGALTAYLRALDIDTKAEPLASKWLRAARREGLRTDRTALDRGWSR